MNFADTLKTLPPVAHVASLTLRDAQGVEVATLPNQPGKAGSLAVYAALADRHGGRIDAEAARQGLELFAEHTAAAREHPGAHPNIDRLFLLIESGSVLSVEKVLALPDRLSTDPRSPHCRRPSTGGV